MSDTATPPERGPDSPDRPPTTPSEQIDRTPAVLAIGRRSKADTELQEFRNLLKPPSTFEDGFTWPAFFGALFVALLMVPGAIYMSLIAGPTIGPAAQWVTLILFIEVARRANQTLRRAEIYTLFYLAGAMIVGDGGLLWNQFFAQSVAAQSTGITELLPNWYAPTDPAVLDQRSFLMWEWLPAIGLLAFSTIMTRLDNVVLGYGLFRLASDIEKLPFPMAPIGAQGIMALSEEQDEELARKAGTLSEEAQGSWRWRTFSMGTVIGLSFGFIYLALPTITGGLLSQPIRIFPIPFRDYTQQTGQFLPAVPVALSMDLGLVLLGMVLPFWAVVGTAAGLLLMMVANPILYQYGVLQSWNEADTIQRTLFKNNLDFYFSFSIGLSVAIAVFGFWSVYKGIRQLRARGRAGETTAVTYDIPKGRGDIAVPWILLTYLTTSSLYILLSMWLIGWSDNTIGVFYVMLFYAFLYTPIISYVTARLEGIAGEVLAIPFVREASFILSGYQGVAVWFLPVPLHNYGVATVRYRECELTGTRFASMWKSELLLTPIILISVIMFANFIWGLAAVPGPQYPYAQELWEVNAANQAIIFSSTLGGYTQFDEALRLSYIGWGFGIGMALFTVLSSLGAPVFFMYGIIRGLNQALPFAVLAQLVGALIGRYYFRKRFGDQWRQMIPVLFAGFACGMGLISTLSIGFTFLVKSVFQLPY